MSKKETMKFVVQLIASIATAILTALGLHRAWRDVIKPIKALSRRLYIKFSGFFFVVSDIMPIFAEHYYKYYIITNYEQSLTIPYRNQASDDHLLPAILLECSSAGTRYRQCKYAGK